MTDHLTENARLRGALRACAEASKQTPKHPACEKVIAEVAAALTTPAPDAVQEAARVLLADADAVMAMAEAYDREDSAQRGEPDPHGALFDNEPDRAEWQDERRHCAIAALRAIAGDRT